MTFVNRQQENENCGFQKQFEGSQFKKAKKIQIFHKKITIYYEATGDDSLGGTCFGVDIY